ncbi:MAG TPA: hypothetical protein VK550_15695 [Polyangiaceae bacterium]|nr:hypothetical protein [Polyangiaceae bacterium]
MPASKYPGNLSKPPGAPVSSQFPATSTNDTGPQIFMQGNFYYRQLDDLALNLCVAKTITDADWLDFLENTLHLARQIGRMPKVTLATFIHTYPDAKQRRETRDYLAAQGVKPIDRLGLLSDNPLVRGAIVAFSWVIPDAKVLAFGSRDIGTCLEWLHEVAIFDQQRASTAWSEGRAMLKVH